MSRHKAKLIVTVVLAWQALPDSAYGAVASSIGSDTVMTFASELQLKPPAIRHRLAVPESTKLVGPFYAANLEQALNRSFQIPETQYPQLANLWHKIDLPDLGDQVVLPSIDEAPKLTAPIGLVADQPALPKETRNPAATVNALPLKKHDQVLSLPATLTVAPRSEISAASVQKVVPVHASASEEKVKQHTLEMTEPDLSSNDLLFSQLEQAVANHSWLDAKINFEKLKAIATPKESKTPSSQMTKSSNLKIAIGKDEVHFEPRSLNFSEVGEQKKVVVSKSGEPLLELALFVRHPETIKWDPAARMLEAAADGSTEIYVVHAGKMFILPAIVSPEGPDASELRTLQIPRELVALPETSVINAAASDRTASPLAMDSSLITENTVSLRYSSSEATNALITQASKRPSFYRPMLKPSYLETTLQFVDERSSGEGEKLYPAAGVSVHIVGTEFVAPSDQRGRLAIKDVPDRSRVLLRVADPHSFYRPTVQQVLVDSSRPHQTLMLMRSETFQIMQRIAGVNQHSGYGSLCATVYHEGSHVPQAGVSVGTDVAAEGPFYFNRFGYLDPRQSQTGPNGRFCMFNIDPGPVSISLFYEGDFWSLYPVGIFAGSHLEDEFDLAAGERIEIFLAGMTTAHEQLSTDVTAVNRLRPVEVIDIMPLGHSERLAFYDDAHLVGEHVSFHRNRSFLLTNAAEFEDTLYDVNQRDEGQVTPLVPRGFIEDLSFYAQIIQDPLLGSVLVEHGRIEGQSEQPIEIFLKNIHGHQVGDGWYFADKPVTKAMFFNVPPGVYSVVVKSAEGYWLSAETVVVYNETLSYIATGSRVSRHLRGVKR